MFERYWKNISFLRCNKERLVLFNVQYIILFFGRSFYENKRNFPSKETEETFQRELESREKEEEDTPWREQRFRAMGSADIS